MCDVMMYKLILRLLLHPKFEQKLSQKYSKERGGKKSHSPTHGVWDMMASLITGEKVVDVHSTSLISHTCTVQLLHLLQ